MCLDIVRFVAGKDGMHNYEKGMTYELDCAASPATTAKASNKRLRYIMQTCKLILVMRYIDARRSLWLGKLQEI